MGKVKILPGHIDTFPKPLKFWFSWQEVCIESSIDTKFLSLTPDGAHCTLLHKHMNKITDFYKTEFSKVWI